MQQRYRIIAAFAAFFATSGALAGPGVWTTTGPEGGDAARVSVDPLAPDTLLAAGRGGVFRSSDGGDFWSRFQDGLDYEFPYGLETASGASTSYLLASQTRLYRSSAGAAWMPTAFALPAGQYATDLSLRPGDGQHLLLGTSQGLQISHDGGASFAPLIAAGLPVGAVARVEYASATRLYVAFDGLPPGATSHVYRSDDGGASFAATAALPDPGFFFLAYLDGDLESAPSDPDRLYFGTSEGMFTSNNGGATWGSCDPDVSTIGQIAIEPGSPARLWVAALGGVHASIDGCANFTPHTTGVSADGTRIDQSRSVALAPTFPADDRVFVGSSFGGVYRSSDAGASFAAANTGLVSTHIRAIAPHPLAADRVLLGYGDAFTASPTLYRSDDGGASWLRSNSGLRATQIRGITIDPTTALAGGGAHVYAVGSSRPQDAPTTPATTDGGIYKSTDGGLTWVTIDNGLPATYLGGTRFIGTVRSAVLDPRSCASPPTSGACSSGPLQTVYVTASGRADLATGAYAAARIYKSTDAGANWSASESGLPAASAGAASCPHSQIAVPLAIAPDDTDVLYVGLSVNQNDPSCPAPTVANGVFKSTDGGASWIHSSNGLPRLGGVGSSHWNVLAIAIDPSDADVLYAAAYETVDSRFVGRVFKSVDAGATWVDSSIGIAGQDVRALLVDPNDPDTVYAGSGGSPTNPGGVYRSDDGGLTWNSFSIGLPVESSTALALDPHDPDRLIAGTNGGAWELTQVPDADADGAATAVENAAPNGGDADGNGVADAAESNVASFFFSGGGPGLLGASSEAITLELEPLAGTCARINNAHALSAATLPADVARGVTATAYARGVLRFELPDCERARVTVTFHGADFAGRDWSWRNYGPLLPGDAATLQWYEFAGATRVGPGRWQLLLDAGARGNYRDRPSDILFVGAPGFLDLQIFGDDFE